MFDPLIFSSVLLVRDKCRGAADALGLSASVHSESAATAVGDGCVVFGDVAGAARADSLDTFTIIHDRSSPFDPGNLTWAISVDPVSEARPMAGSSSCLVSEVTFDSMASQALTEQDEY